AATVPAPAAPPTAAPTAAPFPPPAMAPMAAPMAAPAPTLVASSRRVVSASWTNFCVRIGTTWPSKVCSLIR
ncbi:MAG: hypothetical protein FJW34_08630, partial [Acidobacteria bacterium]|nr:hypothetical protein [Acidobacteriota bacterium]